ncbi:VOC family protein [Luteimonas sp. M1R5S18]|uniref:VOC family protein n=1 Tax=Luteimonas rhizosphaericola TaxID=3042024 RepID=A0ABT6JM76_9GAMM|nr:VOC family protein [Luteimonas rhizosphaericola]MDH5831767.1 VOC family protein [Luteimonas rhizosphaericola]
MPGPTFRAVVPMLRTPDLDRALAFYCGPLGFSLLRRSDADGWASVARDGVELMLATTHTQPAAGAATVSLYVRLADAAAVDALWATLEGHARVSYPPETFAYGMREFGIHDPDGTLLQFGAPAAPPC